MGWLNNSVALITGGGSGLGRALVERFVQEGAKVGVLEFSAERAQALSQDHGEQVEAVVGDVSSYADNLRAVERTVARFGRLDTFIANAGIFDFFQALPQLVAAVRARASGRQSHARRRGVRVGAAKAAARR